jgi:hypothetical protein
MMQEIFEMKKLFIAASLLTLCSFIFAPQSGDNGCCPGCATMACMHD